MMIVEGISPILCVESIYSFFSWQWVKKWFCNCFFKLSSNTDTHHWHKGYIFITHPYLLSRIQHNINLFYFLLCFVCSFHFEKGRRWNTSARNVTSYIQTWESWGRVRGRKREKRKQLFETSIKVSVRRFDAVESPTYCQLYFKLHNTQRKGITVFFNVYCLWPRLLSL